MNELETSIQFLVIVIILYYSFQVSKFIIPQFRKMDEKRMKNMEEQVTKLISKMDILLDKMDVSFQKHLEAEKQIYNTQVMLVDLERRVERVENEKIS